jgi:hypothetical protein
VYAEQTPVAVEPSNVGLLSVAIVIDKFPSGEQPDAPFIKTSRVGLHAGLDPELQSTQVLLELGAAAQPGGHFVQAPAE